VREGVGGEGGVENKRLTPLSGVRQRGWRRGRGSALSERVGGGKGRSRARGWWQSHTSYAGLVLPRHRRGTVASASCVGGSVGKRTGAVAVTNLWVPCDASCVGPRHRHGVVKGCCYRRALAVSVEAHGRRHSRTCGYPATPRVWASSSSWRRGGRSLPSCWQSRAGGGSRVHPRGLAMRQGVGAEGVGKEGWSQKDYLSLAFGEREGARDEAGRR
jgi:hypothetical protein